MLWGVYLRMLHQRPMRTKALTSCCTFSLTDSLAQWRERVRSRELHATNTPPFDPVRTVRNGLFGLLWLGPVNHIFWGRTPLGLEFWFPGSSWRAAFSRVAVDQLTVMPLNMAVFLAWPALLTGQGLQVALGNVRDAFWPAATFAISIWPFVHPLSFRYVPLEHRLLVLNICSVFVFSYATYVSEKRGGVQRSWWMSSRGQSDRATHPASATSR